MYTCMCVSKRASRTRSQPPVALRTSATPGPPVETSVRYMCLFDYIYISYIHIYIYIQRYRYIYIYIHIYIYIYVYVYIYIYIYIKVI